MQSLLTSGCAQALRYDVCPSCDKQAAETGSANGTGSGSFATREEDDGAQTRVGAFCLGVRLLPKGQHSGRRDLMQCSLAPGSFIGNTRVSDAGARGHRKGNTARR